MREPVVRFAQAMEEQLKANKYKGDWGGCSNSYLLNKLVKNLNALIVCLDLPGNNVKTIRWRCANIANFAMMIDDNQGKQ